MAKALMGHLGPATEAVREHEARRLRQRVADLEAEVLRLKVENDSLAAAYARATSDEVPSDLSSLQHA